MIFIKKIFYRDHYYNLKNYRLIEDNLLSTGPIDISNNSFFHLMPTDNDYE